MSVLGKRYATALLQIVAPADSDRALAELESLRDAFGSAPELRKAMENPGIALPEKEAILKALGERAGLLPEVTRFLSLLVVRRRLPLLPEVAASCRDLRDAEAGLVRARLTTARPLAEARVTELRGLLSAALNHPVALEASVREDLLAGAQLQVGSTVFDGSVSGALKALRGIMVKGSV